MARDQFTLTMAYENWSGNVPLTSGRKPDIEEELTDRLYPAPDVYLGRTEPPLPDLWAIRVRTGPAAGTAPQTAIVIVVKWGGMEVPEYFVDTARNLLTSKMGAEPDATWVGVK